MVFLVILALTVIGALRVGRYYMQRRNPQYYISRSLQRDSNRGRRW